MKKLMLCLVPLAMTACSTPTQQSTVPMDMKAVQEYQQRVATGNTVSSTQSEDWELNQSDRKPKVKVYPTYPRVYPTIDYRYGHYGHRRGHYRGVGLGGFYY